MNAKIEFIKNIPELIIPIIKLTKSKNGKTGTATFLFIEPIILQTLENYQKTIDGLYLVWDNKEIYSNDLIIIFKEGKPAFIKSIFIFKNPYEWFNFLSFIKSYSQETGLSFSEANAL